MLTSARGKTHLLDLNNHRYRCDGEFQGNKYWWCLKEGCHLADAHDVDNAELNVLMPHKICILNKTLNFFFHPRSDDLPKKPPAV